MQRPLGHDELPLGVEAWHEAGVDEVTPLLVIGGLQLHPAVVVRQDVREPGQEEELEGGTNGSSWQGSIMDQWFD